MYCIDSIFRDGEIIHFIHIPCEDKNAPILFLSHGFPDNAYGWEKQIEEFKGRYHIVAPFMHGTLNNNKVRNSRINVRPLIEDVVKIIESVQHNSHTEIILMGHDLGCFLNTALYIKFKQRVIGIVNINGLPLSQYFQRKVNVTQWIKSYYIFIAQSFLSRLIIREVMPKIFLNKIYDLCKLDESDTIRENDNRVFRGIYIYQVLFLYIFSYFFREVRKISAPTLFIWGNKDIFLNIPTMDEMEKFHSDAVVRVVEGGHWVLRSNSTHVNRILETTLKRWEKQVSETVSKSNLLGVEV